MGGLVDHWVVDVHWHRDVVVLLADVLHDVLTLAGERCLSHYSGRKRVQSSGKDEIRYL